MSLQLNQMVLGRKVEVSCVVLEIYHKFYLSRTVLVSLDSVIWKQGGSGGYTPRGFLGLSYLIERLAEMIVTGPSSERKQA